jgi:putative phosphonate metabolism protein
MRYAIYYTPPADDPLTRRAALWLGRDAFTGAALPQPRPGAFTSEAFAALTADPRRYGFHATLKAPFALSAEADRSALYAAFDAFAAGARPFVLPALVLGQLGRFFALVPDGPSPDLQALADECVRQFDPFRAPLSEADIARRNPAALPPDEAANLERWGYPYVFESFRFHMTLSAQVDASEQYAMRQAIEAHFADLLARPRPIGHLALFAEPARGDPFVVVRLATLGSTATGKTA